MIPRASCGRTDRASERPTASGLCAKEEGERERTNEQAISLARSAGGVDVEWRTYIRGEGEGDGADRMKERPRGKRTLLLSRIW